MNNSLTKRTMNNIIDELEWVKLKYNSFTNRTMNIIDELLWVKLKYNSFTKRTMNNCFMKRTINNSFMKRTMNNIMNNSFIIPS